MSNQLPDDANNTETNTQSDFSIRLKSDYREGGAFVSGASRRPVREKKQALESPANALDSYTFRFMPLNFTEEDCNLALRDRNAVKPLRANPPSAISFDKLVGLEWVFTGIKNALVIPLRAPQFFKDLGLQPNLGILLHGYSGTGKTSVCRGVLDLCNKVADLRVAYFAPKVSDLCRSADALSILFREAKKLQPAIICIENVHELTSKATQSNSLLASTFLTELCGVEQRGLVWVMGCISTYDLHKVDSDFRRAGRFDLEYDLRKPDAEVKLRMLTQITKSWSGVTSDILKFVADSTRIHSRGDIVEICRQAAVESLKRTNPHVFQLNEVERRRFLPIQLQESDFKLAVENYRSRQ